MTEDIKIPQILPDDVVLTKIYLISDHKVMIDKDLAQLYGIETKRLKEAVRRNRKRFPKDFMFEMSKEELENWRTQFATSNSERMGLRYPPFCFTEQELQPNESQEMPVYFYIKPGLPEKIQDITLSYTFYRHGYGPAMQPEDYDNHAGH